MYNFKKENVIVNSLDTLENLIKEIIDSNEKIRFICNKDDIDLCEKSDIEYTTSSLEDIIKCMHKRYDMLNQGKVRTIKEYISKGKDMDYTIVITSITKEDEDNLEFIARESRAVGIRVLGLSDKKLDKKMLDKFTARQL